MSTTTKRRRRNKTVENEETFTAEPQPRRRRRWWLLSIFAFLVTVVWLLPGIIANTPLLPWILAKATADLNGTLQVKSASLGWFSPIAVEEIEVRDAAQQPILQAALLKGDTSLAAILWDSSKLGTLRLENPKLNVVLRSDGSNVEDLIAKYLEPSEGPSAELHTVLEIVDGSVTITDGASYGIIVLQGHGKMGVWDIETPTLIRFGQLTRDEFFVSESAAKDGVTISNPSDSDPLVMLKHLGPGNPDLKI